MVWDGIFGTTSQDLVELRNENSELNGAREGLSVRIEILTGN